MWSARVLQVAGVTAIADRLRGIVRPGGLAELASKTRQRRRAIRRNTRR